MIINNLFKNLHGNNFKPTENIKNENSTYNTLAPFIQIYLLLTLCSINYHSLSQLSIYPSIQIRPHLSGLFTPKLINIYFLRINVYMNNIAVNFSILYENNILSNHHLYSSRVNWLGTVIYAAFSSLVEDPVYSQVWTSLLYLFGLFYIEPVPKPFFTF